MANYFSNMVNNAADWLASKIAPHLNDRLGVGYGVLGNYYQGDHRKQLKVTTDKETGRVTDDNVVINYVGLAVDRSVSRVFRGGVKFKLPEGREKQDKYLTRLWDLNKKEILLHQTGLHGAVYGTSYLKTCPDEVIDPYTQEIYPRLVALDPEIVRIKTDPQDMNQVWFYLISFSVGEKKHWEVVIRSDLEYGFDTNGNVVAAPKKPDSPESAETLVNTPITWLVEEWEQVGGGLREKVSSVKWEYDFPPIIHWKNLPSLKSCYGDSDIDDAINVQDKSNFVSSNTSKIIKFYAHPTTIGTGFSLESMNKMEGSVNAFYAIPDKDAKVANLEMESDLSSSVVFGAGLKQAIFDTSREVDISSMADKLGALTNFGLQVLWSDSIDKNSTKRALYGDAILEQNRRLLVLSGVTGEESNPGTLLWGNPLPINVNEEMQADKMALEMGIIDKETVSNRYKERYGKSWDDIKKAVEKEQAEANKNNDNVGAAILRNFNRGGNQVPNNRNQVR